MAGETIRDVVVRISLKQIEAELRAPNVKPAEQAVERFNKGVEDAGKKFQESMKPVEEQYQKIGSAQDAVRKNQEFLARETEVAGLMMRGGLMLAAEGAFETARGLALIGLEEDNLAKVVQQVAKIQAGLDLLKGPQKIVTGLKVAFNQLSKAQEAVAASGKRLGDGAASYLKALKAVPTKAWIGLGLAVAVVTALIQEANREEERLAAARKKRDEDRKAAIEDEKKAIISREQSRAAAIRFAAPRFDRSQELRAEKGDLTIKQRLLEIEKERRDVLRSGKFGKESGFAAGQRARQLDEKSLSILRENESILSRTRGIREKELQIENAKLDSIKKQAQSEKDRLSSLKARLGQLSGQDAATLKQIAKKQAGGGKLNLDEAAFLQKTGFGTAASQKRFEEEGEKRGFAGIASAFGETDNLKRLESQAAESRKKSVDLQAKLASAATELSEAEKDTGEQIVRLLASINRIQRDNKDRIEELAKEVEAERIQRRP